MDQGTTNNDDTPDAPEPAGGDPGGPAAATRTDTAAPGSRQLEIPALGTEAGAAETRAEVSAEPQADLLAEAPAEPQTEALAEPQTEAPAEPQADLLAEASAEPQAEASAEAPAEPQAEADPGTGDGSDELIRLEGLLRAKAAQAADLERALRRHRRLLRQLDGQLAAIGQRGGADADAASVALRDGALGRAVEAEAALAEVAFRLDEALGHLAVARGPEGNTTQGNTTKGNATEGNATARTDRKGRAPQTRSKAAPAPAAAAGKLAEVQGRLRGLRAALAEAEEARDTAQARLLLMEHEQDELRGEVKTQTRLLSEREKELELALLRAIPEAERAAEVDLLSRRLGEINGLRARVGECEAALLAANQRAVGQEADTEAGQLAEREQEFAVLQRQLEAKVAELEAEAAAGKDRFDQASRELQRRDLEARAELEAISARANHAESQAASLESHLTELEGKLQQALAALSTAQAAEPVVDGRSEALRAALQDVRGRLAALAADLAEAGGATPRPVASIQTVPGTEPAPTVTAEAESTTDPGSADGEALAALQAVHERTEHQRRLEAEEARRQRDELLDALDRHERRRKALELALRGMQGLVSAQDPLAGKLAEVIDIATA